MKSTDGIKELWRGNGVSIGVYEHGFTLHSVRVAGSEAKTPGEVTLVTPRYYMRLEGALQAAATRVAAAEATTLRGYVETLQRVAVELAQAVTGGAE